MRSEHEVVSVPLVEQQQEEGQRHHSDGTLDPKVFHRGHDYLGRTMSDAEPEESEAKHSGFARKAELPGVVPTTWLLEVGFRAALHTESLPRDERWFRGLDWKERQRNG